MVYLLRISINLQVFYILGACSSAQILSVSSWPHPVVYHSFSSCIAHKMKWYLCTKDWATKALLNSDVWTLHMHVCLHLIYFKPPPSVLLSACECHEVSASWFAHSVCARQENKQMITGRENQSILKLCCLSFLEWKREFCRVFLTPKYSILDSYSQVLTWYIMPIWGTWFPDDCLHHLVTSVLTRPLLSKRISRIVFLCQTNEVRMHSLCCRHWPGVQHFWSSVPGTITQCIMGGENSRATFFCSA